MNISFVLGWEKTYLHMQTQNEETDTKKTLSDCTWTQEVTPTYLNDMVVASEEHCLP